MGAVDAPGRARRIAVDGDTLWATVRPNRRAHGLLHEPPDNLVISTGLAVLSPEAVPASFLFELTSTPEFTEYLVSRATGAAYPAVRPADFAEAPIIVPPTSLLDEFARVVDPMHRAVGLLNTRNRALAATRDLLLPRLVSGRLDVSDVDLGDLLNEAEAA
jgi:type I restriction enzyme S subunit